MSLAEIKQEATRLPGPERRELALQLAVLEDLEDPAFLADLTRAHADAEQGIADLAWEELLTRLKAAGRSLPE